MLNNSRIKMRIKTKLQWFNVDYLFLIAFFIFPFHKGLADNNIGPDDVLRIGVYGYDDLTTETRVSSDGMITFPLAGEIKASGKTPIALEETISARLRDGGFIKDAHVNIRVLEQVSQQISVVGYVKSPGRYPMNSDSSIVDLIAMAGGINDTGDNKAIVTRIIDGKVQKQEVDLWTYLESGESVEAFKVQKGDVVYVPKAPMFYIYGEVQRPGSYRLELGLSVVKALSIGGGLTLRGTENCIVFKRKNQSGVLEEVDANLGDPVLNEDVIYVDERWF
jgi:polysaccharide biosynthesis/export protein